MSSSKTDGCQRCGDCCFYADFVIVTDEDLQRLAPLIAQHDLQIRRGNPLSLLCMGDPCVFLDMCSGVPVCLIHDEKPSTCAAFCCDHD